MGLGGFGVAKTGPAIGGKSAEIKYLFIYFFKHLSKQSIKVHSLQFLLSIK